MVARERPAPGLRQPAVRHRARRRHPDPRPRGGHRHRGAATAGSTLENRERFEGEGVYYGATFVESQLCARRGGGRRRRRQLRRSGGGVPRPDRAARAHAGALGRPGPRACRATSSAESRTIRPSPCARAPSSPRSRAATTSSGCRWRDDRTGDVQTHPIRHVFSMTGAVPTTAWLDGCVAARRAGFVKTGPDIGADELAAAALAARPPAPPAGDEPPGRVRGRRRAAAAASSEWRRRSARAPSPSPSSTGSSPSRRGDHVQQSLLPSEGHRVDQAPAAPPSARSASRSATSGCTCAPARSAAPPCAATAPRTATPPATLSKSGHPVVASAEPGERWLYCYPDDGFVEY